MASEEKKWWERPWPYFAGAAALLLVTVASQVEVQRPSVSAGTVKDLLSLRDQKDLNVLFILVDTLRADHLGIYGYDRDVSPNIDSLARGGIVFENTVSQSSWTKTSMASLWTGNVPANHGIVHYDHVIPDEAVLPAELFREAGYQTAGIFRNGWVASTFGFDQGFNAYIRPRAGRANLQMQRLNPSGASLQGTDEDLVISAQEFLNAYSGERFFLYLHMMDVHQYVYDDKSVEYGTSYLDIYDQSISWTDRLIAHLVVDLEERGLRDKTLIVIASDHGEAFREHGWEGHAKNLYSEVTRVPMIFIPPFYIEGGITIDNLVSNIDLFPTVLDMVGLPPIPGADGVSLLPLILSAAGVSDSSEGDFNRPAFSHLNKGWGKRKGGPAPLVGVTDGDLQLFYHTANPDSIELYDLGEDPGEKQNLSGERSAETARLVKMAKDYLELAESPWGVEPSTKELNELQLGQLRALGYAID
ncbi:sulfatase-like hydrolase/transferase [Myxococcota bacterium]|nr:sulfatase-like hydrolase/transferase [Myxococcota bacterium]